MKKIALITLTLFVLGCTGTEAKEKSNQENTREKQTQQTTDGKDHMYAVITTIKGEIRIELAYEVTPLTVANFVALAEGDMPNPYKENGVPYYDGLTFHRVIADFMIQGGDPLGTGSGNPGYSFKDEFTYLEHDRPGTLSMANSGPATNGSQFFITHKETPWLNGKHTVFGYVVKGIDVVNQIQKDDFIVRIKIVREGQSAQDFNAIEVFEALK